MPLYNIIDIFMPFLKSSTKRSNVAIDTTDVENNLSRSVRWHWFITKYFLKIVKFNFCHLWCNWNDGWSLCDARFVPFRLISDKLPNSVPINVCSTWAQLTLLEFILFGESERKWYTICHKCVAVDDVVFIVSWCSHTHIFFLSAGGAISCANAPNVIWNRRRWTD